MPPFKIGDTVQYYSYGILQSSTIESISSCSKILHLTNGKWIHSISVIILIKGS
jgi:hypothetical protein